MIKKADINKDGYVDGNEFSEFLTQDLYDIAQSLDVELTKPNTQRNAPKGGTKGRVKMSTRSFAPGKKGTNFRSRIGRR